MTTTLFPAHLHTTLPSPVVHDSHVRLVSAGENLWRVQDRPGHILGHIRAIEGTLGVSYRAQRWNALARTFRSLGEFWDAGDAVAALRFG